MSERRERIADEDLQNALALFKQSPAMEPIDDGHYGVMCATDMEDWFLQRGVHIMEWYEAEPGLQRIRIKRRADALIRELDK